MSFGGVEPHGRSALGRDVQRLRRYVLEADGALTDRARKFIANTPFQRFGEPEELTGPLIYLLSDASRFVTGETMLVDGGFNAYSGV